MLLVAFIMGMCIGTSSFALLCLGLYLAKRSTPTSNLGHAGALMLGVFGSFLVLAISLILCALLARDLVLYMGLSAAGSLVISALAFGLRRIVFRR